MGNVKRALVLGLILSVMGFSLVGQVYAGPGENAAPRKIVVFKASVSEAARDEILSHAKAHKVKGLSIVNATVVLATPASETALRQRAEVLRIDDDAIAQIHVKPAPVPPPAESLPWGVNRIGAALVWDQNGDLTLDAGANTGEGVKVAIVDTGIDLDHPDLQANIKGNVNTINPRLTGNDDNGHGSHVAGIVAGVENSQGVIGVAPKAWLYAVKVLNKQGSGYVSDIIEGLQWCVDNQIQVINMSLGLSVDVPSFHDAVIAAYNAGIVIVASAGNEGPGDNTVGYPARYTEVIAVSATASNDTIASWSSRGPEVELAAPGASIYSAYKDAGYKTLSGTSMASPHVAGAAALVIASGVTDPAQVRARLQSTADDLGSADRDPLYGYGLVDADGAVAGAQTP